MIEEIFVTVNGEQLPAIVVDGEYEIENVKKTFGQMVFVSKEAIECFSKYIVTKKSEPRVIEAPQYVQDFLEAQAKAFIKRFYCFESPNMGKVVVGGTCAVTGHWHHVEVNTAGLLKWLNRTHLIQEALPDTSDETREFLLSRTSPEGWRIMFPNEEEE